jgi:hypothetical protein
MSDAIPLYIRGGSMTASDRGFDISVFSQSSFTESGWRFSHWRRFAPSFLAKCREEVPKMLELLSASDFARLATLSHNLKGCGGGYGLPELGRLGASLEQLAMQKNGGALATRLIELRNYLDRVQLVATR